MGMSGWQTTGRKPEWMDLGLAAMEVWMASGHRFQGILWD